MFGIRRVLNTQITPRNICFEAGRGPPEEMEIFGGRGGLTVGPWTAFSIQNLDEGKRRNMLEIIMFRFHDKSWGCYEKNRELFLDLRDQWL